MSHFPFQSPNHKAEFIRLLGVTEHIEECQNVLHNLNLDPKVIQVRKEPPTPREIFTMVTIMANFEALYKRYQ